jgi:O-antigen/teichoic acid export membrane protein
VSEAPARGFAPPRLARTVLHTLGTSALSAPMALLGMVVVARVLGPTGKGAYDLLIATGNLTAILLGFSLPAGITYVVARGRTGMRRLPRTLGSVLLGQGIAAALVLGAVSLSPVRNAFFPAGAGMESIAGVLLFFVLTCGLQYTRSILLGCQQIVAVNRIDLLNRGLMLAALVLAGAAVLLEVVPASPLPFLWASVGAVLVSTIAAAWRAAPWLRAADGPEGLPEMARYALPAYLGNAAQFLNYRLDLFLVGYFLGAGAVGLYTVAGTLAQVIWLLSNAAAGVMLPRVAAQEADRHGNALRAAALSRACLLAGGAGALVLAAFAHFLLPAVFGAEFRESVRPLLILLPGVVAVCGAAVLAAFLGGIGRPGINMAVAAVALAVTAVLDVLLIPRMGIQGAALASTVSYVATAVITAVVFLRLSGIRTPGVLLPSRGDLGTVMRMLRERTARPPAGLSQAVARR